MRSRNSLGFDLKLEVGNLLSSWRATAPPKLKTSHQKIFEAQGCNTLYVKTFTSF